MAYEPKRLFVARCVRCGKPLYKGDDAFFCRRDRVYFCPICYRAVHAKCPICLSPLEVL